LNYSNFARNKKYNNFGKQQCSRLAVTKANLEDKHRVSKCVSWNTWMSRDCVIVLDVADGSVKDEVLVYHLEFSDAVAECESHVSELGGVLRVRYWNSRRHHVRIANSLHLYRRHGTAYSSSVVCWCNG